VKSRKYGPDLCVNREKNGGKMRKNSAIKRVRFRARHTSNNCIAPNFGIGLARHHVRHGEKQTQKSHRVWRRRSNLEAKIEELGDVSVKSVDDCRSSLVGGWSSLARRRRPELSKSVHALARLLEQADYDQPEIIEVLSERGLPQLFRLYDRVAFGGRFRGYGLSDVFAHDLCAL